MSDLKKLLIETYRIDPKSIYDYHIVVIGLKFIKIRDYLIIKGKIYYEDLNNKIYVAIVYGGIGHKNPAYLAMQLIENKIIINISAKEGLINQHTIEGVINEFKAEFKDYIEE